MSVTTTHQWLEEAAQSIRSAKEGERNTRLANISRWCVQNHIRTPELKDEAAKFLLETAIELGVNAEVAKRTIANELSKVSYGTPCYEKPINEGEECPYCMTMTKPGSTVCPGCGAERVEEFSSTSTMLLVISGSMLFAGLLVSAFSANPTWIILGVLAFAGTCWTVRKNTFYAWQRRTNS